jgi:hypothetical protein
MMVHDFVLMISSIDISFLMWKFGGWEICTKTSDGRWGWPTHMQPWWFAFQDASTWIDYYVE